MCLVQKDFSVRVQLLSLAAKLNFIYLFIFFANSIKIGNSHSIIHAEDLLHSSVILKHNNFGSHCLLILIHLIKVLLINAWLCGYLINDNNYMVLFLLNLSRLILWHDEMVDKYLHVAASKAFNYLPC